jgi:hypothetical protein
MSVEAKEVDNHVLDQPNFQDKFRTATVALHDCNVLENRRVDAICEEICAGTKGGPLR